MKTPTPSQRKHTAMTIEQALDIWRQAAAGDLPATWTPLEGAEAIRLKKQLEAAAPDLFAALQDLFDMMDEGLLVRDTKNDADSGWAIKQLRFVSRLKKADDALRKAKGGGDE